MADAEAVEHRGRRGSRPGLAALGALLVLAVVGLFPQAQAQGFDPSLTLWGPGRRSSGEIFRSAAVPLEPGAFRLTGDDWSLGLGGQFFARSELRLDRDFRPEVPDDSFFTDHRARFTARASLRGILGVVLEYQDVRVWGTEASTVSNDPFTGLHQGFVDVRLNEGLWNLRIGRQELCYGEDRLLGCLDWAQSARSFDGLWGRMVPGERFTVDAFAFTLRDRAFLGAPGATVLNRGSHLFGGYGRWRPQAGAGLDAYALGLSTDPSALAAGFLPTRNFATLGGRGFLRGGPLSLVAEGAYQLGWQGERDIRAFGTAVRATATAPWWASPYVMFEHLYASGDDDPTDGTIRTFNQLFPTAHIHLGYADLVGWQNVQSVRGTVGFRPWGTHVWLDVHQFWNAQPQDAWYDAAGGVFVAADPLRTDRNMGTEIDLSATVPLTPELALACAYTLFLPGSAARPARGADASHWAFAYLRSQW